jgi:hypothetical protein
MRLGERLACRRIPAQMASMSWRPPLAASAALALLFSLPHDLPAEWAAFAAPGDQGYGSFREAGGAVKNKY